MDTKVFLTAALGAGVGALVALGINYAGTHTGKAVVEQVKPPTYDTADLDNKIRNAVLSQASALREAVPGPKVYPPVATPTVQVGRGCAQWWRGRRARAPLLLRRCDHTCGTCGRISRPVDSRALRTQSVCVHHSPMLLLQKRILITGGAGFVGSNLVDVLMMQVRESIEVRVRLCAGYVADGSDTPPCLSPLSRLAFTGTHRVRAG